MLPKGAWLRAGLSSSGLQWASVGFSGLQWAANLKVISKSEPDCKLEHRTGHRAAHCDNELSWYVISGLIVEPEKEIVPVTMPRPNR